jgi:hypothetical protein
MYCTGNGRLNIWYVYIVNTSIFEKSEINEMKIEWGDALAQVLMCIDIMKFSNYNALKFYSYVNKTEEDFNLLKGQYDILHKMI